jgi:succinate dehydrogenase / fumarate reductase, flavoprotein subunit
VKLGIEFYNEFYVLDLVMNERQASCGVVAYELAPETFTSLHAKSIVFATGGFGKIYKTTSNAHTLTGDGVAIIYRKGLPLGGHGVLPVPPHRLAGLGILALRGSSW